MIGRIVLLVLWAAEMAAAAERITLTPENWADNVPRGKESDAIIGDTVLRNDRIVCAIADPRLMSGRSASRWAIPNVAGAVLDLTRRDDPRDLLTAFYPARPRFKPDAPNYQHEFIEETESCRGPGREPVHAPRVTLDMPPYEIESGIRLEELEARPPHLRTSPRPFIEVRYALEDGWDFLEIETVYVNPTDHPFPFSPMLSLRVDDPCRSGLDFNDRLFWTYEPWWGAAIGVWSANPPWSPQGIRPPRHPLTLRPDTAAGWTIPPRGRIRFVFRLIPAANLFDLLAVAAPWANQTVHRLDLHLDAPDGPVEGAEVVLTRDLRRLAGGRTDANGWLRLTVPADGSWSVRAEPFGRPPFESVLTPDHLAVGRLEMRVRGAPRLRLQVQDETGAPLPARVSFYGRNGTPNPFFFPSTGEFRVRHHLQRHDGRFDELIPPGQYQVIISHGPEYEADAREIRFSEGALVAWTCTLRRAYATPGWISADLHNHATRSGISELFYVYPYTKCPVVDGDSTASPLGRVLALLASDIHFAVLTDHNFSGTFQPELERLGMTHRMLTCPGIGFTAGRRHTTTHQNVFPVRHDPGRQDGGVPQRPEHVGQLAWIRSWDSDQERLILIAVPQKQPLDITTGMDALDLQDLEPLVEGRPLPGRNNRVLDWIVALNQGYRLPAILNSGTFDNATGVGARRTYVAVGTSADNVRPETIVRAVRHGHVIMTTAPFLKVELITPTATAGPGDEVALPEGYATLRIRVLTPSFVTLHRVQVLNNGQRSPALQFTPETHPALFGPPPLAFQADLPLTLREDAHLVVVASGPGASWLDPAVEDPRSQQTHVAVSNPIWVDVGGDGYSPRSPLLDTVQTAIDFLRPPLADPRAPEPGLIRVTMKNTGSETAEGQLCLEVNPPTAGDLIEPAERNYSLPPGGETAYDWSLRLSPSLLASQFPLVSTYNNADSFGLRVRRGPPPSRHRPAQAFMQLDYPLRSLPPLRLLSDISPALANTLAFPLTIRGQSTPFGTARWAVSGSHLVVSFEVADPHPQRREIAWEGSCVELFGSLPGRSSQNKPEWGFFPIRQVYLMPAVGAEPPQALHREGETIRPAPEIMLTSATTSTGYRLDALIPLSLLGTDVDFLPRALFFSSGFHPVVLIGLDPTPGRILLEARATIPQPPPNPPLRPTLFGSRAPHADHNSFGRFRLMGPVTVQSRILRPVTLTYPDPSGECSLLLSNASPERVSDRLLLRVEPAGQAELRPSDGGQWDPANDYSFDLDSGETRTFTITVQSRKDLQTAWLELHVPRSPAGTIAGIPLIRLPVVDRPLPLLPVVPEDLRQALNLPVETPCLRIPPQAEPSGTVQLAMTPRGLWLKARISDDRITRTDPPWKGSCLELFAAPPEDPTAVRQIFLLPPAGGQPASAAIAESGQPLAASDIAVLGQSVAGGYELTALIPLPRLGFSEVPERLLLEIQLDRIEGTNAPAYHSAFGAPRAYQSGIGYGAFRVTRP